MVRQGIAAAAGGAYALVYLALNGDLDWIAPAAWGYRVASDPALWLAMRGPFRFEAVAMLELGHLLVLVSPLNLAVAAVLGWLLALNVHGALALRAAPRCAAGGSGALTAAVPALLAGTACCAPSVLLLLGIPALGVVAGALPWLVPVSAALLAAARAWQRRHGAPRWRVLPVWGQTA